MFFHIRFLVESLSAVLAGVRPRIGVDEEVGGQGGGSLEGFPTLLALQQKVLGNLFIFWNCPPFLQRKERHKLCLLEDLIIISSKEEF